MDNYGHTGNTVPGHFPFFIHTGRTVTATRISDQKNFILFGSLGMLFFSFGIPYFITDAHCDHTQKYLIDLSSGRMLCRSLKDFFRH